MRQGKGGGGGGTRGVRGGGFCGGKRANFGLYGAEEGNYPYWPDYTVVIPMFIVTEVECKETALFNLQGYNIEGFLFVTE